MKRSEALEILENIFKNTDHICLERGVAVSDLAKEVLSILIGVGFAPPCDEGLRVEILRKYGYDSEAEWLWDGNDSIYNSGRWEPE